MMNKNFLIYSSLFVIIFFSILTFIFAVYNSDYKYMIIEKLENFNIISKNINLINKKEILNQASEINNLDNFNNNSVHNSLYKYQINTSDKLDINQDMSLYMTLDKSESKSKFLENKNLIKLHTNNFWDPKKCSQMQSIVGTEKIVFLDSYVEFAEMAGFNTFIYSYDRQANKLEEIKSPISLIKIYKSKNIENNIANKEEYMAIGKVKMSDDINLQNQKYRIYKINFEENKLEFIKDIFQESKYQLLTATNIMVWCEQFSGQCKKEDTLNIIENNLNLEINKSNQSVYTVDVKYKNESVFNLKEIDNLRYFIIGV